MSEPTAPEPIRLVIDNAEETPAPAEPASDEGGKRGKPRDGGLPEGCPVTPLGVHGEICFYLDALRQLRPFGPRDHSRAGILSLFGAHVDRLYDYFPKTSAEGVTTSWRPEKALEALMGAAARKGVWNAAERVRGPGGWKDGDGRLILHCGDAVLIDDAWLPPGAHGPHVYSAAPARPRPTENDQDGACARELLALFGTWRWRRAIDARLLLGWLGAAMLGGALDWRPMVWITGDRATGKSTLHGVLVDVLGEAGLVSVSDPTAAGIWQKLGQASLPVAIDELEAEEDNRKQAAIIKLARQAASGGVILRGGADHGHSEFTARSAFLFSSILIPPLQGQDRSRMAILDLGPLETTSGAKVDHARQRFIGRALRRRLVMGWPRFPEIVERYRQALASHGHKGRGADQFGTLLACAEVMVADDFPDSDTVDELAETLAAATLAETADDAPDHERCLAHLMTSVVDPWRNGTRKTIGALVRDAAADDPAKGEDADRALALHGIRVIPGPQFAVMLAGRPPEETEPWSRTRHVIAIANAHRALAELYAGSHWAARSGTNGVWTQALRRVPGAIAWRLRFDAVRGWATAIDADHVLQNGTDEP